MTITLSNKQASVILAALEAFQRARMGQFSMALEQIFPKKCLNKGWEEMQDLEIELKKFFFGDELSKNSYWGIPNKEQVGEDAQIAYEIFGTMRQFMALEKSGGIYEGYTNYNSPLKLSNEPLPEIDGHKELTYKIHEFPDQVAAKKLLAEKKFDKLWEMVEDMKLPYGYCRAREIMLVEGNFPETQKLVLRVEGPHKPFSETF